MSKVRAQLSEAGIMIYSVFQAIQSQGFLKMLEMVGVALQDEFHDWKKGLKRSAYLDPRHQNLSHPHVPHANFYQPVRSGPFLEVFRTLDFSKNLNFVDVGSGTAKSLFLAADLGFKTLKGIELVPELCQVAEENVQRLASKYPGCEFQIQCIDATEYDFVEGDGVIFLNDPFHEPVFEKFVPQLIAHSQRVLHPVHLIYKNNAKRNIRSLLVLKEKSRYREINIRGNHYQIYQGIKA